MVQVQESIAVSDKISNAKDMFSSEACAPMRKEMNDYLEGLVAENTDEEIIEWSCNDLQRKQSMKRVKAKEMDIATQTNPCIRAVDALVAEAVSDGTVDADLGDKALCGKELGKALAELKNNLDSAEFVEAGFIFTFGTMLFLIAVPFLPPPP